MQLGPDFWNSPFVSQIAFVPRKTARSGRPDAQEGTLQVGDAELGYVLYARSGAEADAPVVLYCHANAETAADVAGLAPVLFEGVSVCRGRATAGVASHPVVSARSRRRRGPGYRLPRLWLEHRRSHVRHAAD